MTVLQSLFRDGSVRALCLLLLLPSPARPAGESTAPVTYLADQLNDERDVEIPEATRGNAHFAPGRLRGFRHKQLGGMGKVILQSPLTDAPSRLIFRNLRIAPGAEFAAGVGVWCAGLAEAEDVSFSLSIDTGDGPVPAARRDVTAPDRWTDLSVDLSAYAGRVISLHLTTASPRPRGNIPAYWGEPRIIVFPHPGVAAPPPTETPGQWLRTSEDDAALRGLSDAYKADVRVDGSWTAVGCDAVVPVSKNSATWPATLHFEIFAEEIPADSKGRLRIQIETLDAEGRETARQTVSAERRKVVAGQFDVASEAKSAARVRLRIEPSGKTPILFFKHRLARRAPASLGARDASLEQARPNLIILSLDTLRADRLGVYGNENGLSRRLDAFAREATLYTRAISTSPWTLPSHASLFCGKRPFEHGARTFKVKEPAEVENRPLSENSLTIAEVLRDEEFATAAFCANAGFLHPEYKLDQGFETYKVRYEYSPDVNRKVLRWLQDQGGSPFFLFVNYMDTHVPYNTSPRDGFPVYPRGLRDRTNLHVDVEDAVLGKRQPPPKESIETVSAMYDLSVANLDSEVGELIDHLRASGVYDNSMLVVLSDHGEFLGEHDLVGHNKDLYQEVIWIPLIIKYPGQRRARVEEGLISIADLPGLIISRLLGEAAKPYMESFPLAPGGRDAIAEQHFLPFSSRLTRNSGERFNRERFALFNWPYVYIRSSDGRNEMYDLSRDPAQSSNLIEVEAPVALKLEERLEGALVGGDAPDRVEAVEIDEELLRSLKALGYL
jgi:arylsulfatase A-like enzyme